MEIIVNGPTSNSVIPGRRHQTFYRDNQFRLCLRREQSSRKSWRPHRRHQCETPSVRLSMLKMIQGSRAEILIRFCYSIAGAIQHVLDSVSTKAAIKIELSRYIFNLSEYLGLPFHPALLSKLRKYQTLISPGGLTTSLPSLFRVGRKIGTSSSLSTNSIPCSEMRARHCCPGLMGSFFNAAAESRIRPDSSRVRVSFN